MTRDSAASNEGEKDEEAADGDTSRERREAAEDEMAEKADGEMSDGAVESGGAAAKTAAADGWWQPLLTAECGLMGSAALEPDE